MLGRDPYSGYMACVIRLEEPDDKARHGAVLSNYAVRNRFGSGEQIFESVAAVCFAVNKATLIQPPTLVDLGNGEWTKIVARIDRRDQSDGGLALRLWRQAAIKPPPRTKFLENCHKRLSVRRGTERAWRRL